MFKVTFSEGNLKEKGVWPGGVVIEFTHSASAAWGSRVGFPGWVPGHGPTHHSPNHTLAVSHKQNRGRLVQMLAQGQSSSQKKKKKKEILLMVNPSKIERNTETNYDERLSVLT